ncbi:MAG: MFS transporter [Acidobacteria bacterium]|nr:MFS transporter [Acidobacteriota bacterium]
MLKRLGLDRPDLRAWAMYDWANSAFQTTVIAGVFPIYYSRVAAVGLDDAVAQSRFYWASTLAIVAMALVAPVLGALADAKPIKKTLLGIFVAIGVAACVGMWWIREGDWTLALILFVIGNIAVAGSIVFYESLLPFLTTSSNIDRVSTAGYAIGYIGGGSLLAINLLMIQQPAWFGLPDAGVATRLSLVSVGVWWLAFSIPLFRRVAEPCIDRPSRATTFAGSLAEAFRQLGHTFKTLKRYRQAMLMLIAFFLYNDGIQTIIRVATYYGADIGIDTGSLITALLLVQFIGVPCSFLFGMLASRIGAKRSVFLGLLVYVGITIFAYRMTTAWEFFALAITVGMVQGGTQALSRSLFASMVPKDKSSEFFAFFGVFERYAGILGPALFAVLAGSGSSRTGIISMLVFFVTGMAVLWFVDVKKGQQEVLGS